MLTAIECYGFASPTRCRAALAPKTKLPARLGWLTRSCWRACSSVDWPTESSDRCLAHGGRVQWLRVANAESWSTRAASNAVCFSACSSRRRAKFADAPAVNGFREKRAETAEPRPLAHADWGGRVRVRVAHELAVKGPSNALLPKCWVETKLFVEVKVS